MPKQIKLGLDKVPAPVTKQFVQLIDIEGNKLFDAAGNPVITEEEAVLGSFATSAGSTSVYANNRDNNPIISVPIAEQFSETSEVSSSLLGVPRAEEQLSLFSDVSTYGLDEDNWNFYTFSNATYPTEWYNKENPVYGNRSNPTFNEGSEEQALYLRSYPSQYTFPGSTLAENSSAPSETMKNYMQFIAMGTWLYEIFYTVNPVFAKYNFLNPNIYIVNSSNVKVDTTTRGLFDTGALVFGGDGSFFDVEYGTDIQDSFNQIERWTYLYNRIVDGDAVFPLITNAPTPDFTLTAEYAAVRSFLSSRARPGGSSTAENFAILQSQKTFRYQPGRASGFTFGVRQQTDTSSNANFIEWGCSNDTDEYMFQLRGSEFNIIRRSTIQMPDALLVRQGLEATDQGSSPVSAKGVTAGEPLWETIIPRTKFNGDSMLGSGKSGYILSFEDVTMYKIEFSWYGAIGAKFYAYAPAAVGEARWILMHTFVIENGLGKPVLNNPDFKFKYLLYAANTATLKYPIYLYKYGSSYYVDGGDEGTINLTSVTADSKQFTTRTPIIGILPKQEIRNTDGIGLANFKKAYPSTLSVTSDLAARVDIESVVGSPDGAHYSFSPSLHNGTHALSRTLDFQFNGTNGQVLDIKNGGALNLADDNGKIIADGIYNAYVDYDYIASHDSTSIRRKDRTYNLTAPGPASAISKSTKLNGTVIDTSDATANSFTGKVTNFHSVAASTVPIQSNNFKIHFLNPSSRAAGYPYHFTDFAICIGTNLPTRDGTDSNKLKYTKENGDLDVFSFSDVVSIQGSQTGTSIDYSTKAERYEWDPAFGNRFSVDTRLPAPGGADTGSINSVKGEVRVTTYPVSSIEAGGSGYGGQFKLTFTGGAPPIALFPVDASGAIVANAAEVGTDGVGLGIFYTSLPQTVDGVTFVYVNQNPSTFGGSRTIIGGSGTGVQTKTIKLTDDWQLDPVKFTNALFSVEKAVKFNSQPLYLTFAMHDDCKINNIMVEEITEDNVQVKTPSFIKGDECPNLAVVASGGSSAVLSPAAFNTDDRQSSIRFDTQTLNPLRTGTIIYSFFIAANKPEQFDLSNIFGRDRKGIARGLLNNSAVFLTASAVDGSSVGNIEMTLTAKEQ